MAKSKKSKGVPIPHKGRGSHFEHLINITNENYKNQGKAVVHHPATQSMVKGGKQIYVRKSAVDYLGVNKDGGLLFEAKSTKEKSLPLAMIKPEQTRFLMHALTIAGDNVDAFFLFDMRAYGVVFRTGVERVVDFINLSVRASIPYCYLFLHSGICKAKNGVPVDYLEPIYEVDKEEYELQKEKWAKIWSPPTQK